MTALLNKERRDRARKARRERREETIEAASHLFVRQPYVDVTMDTIGRRVGVARGLASLHFATKEDLFLEVLKRELAGWFDDTERWLNSGPGPIHGAALTRFLAEDLAGRPTLTRLLVVLHNVLEQNVEVDSAHGFVDWLHERGLALARRLDDRCAGFEVGDGAALLRRLAVFVVGMRQTAHPSGIFSALLLDEQLAPFHVALREELEFLLARVLPGA